jgi:A/G-specific adenine glycosylase
MLHKAAQVVALEHGGIMPITAAALRTLPGIGAYTSAAIASIAHSEPVAVVDGNVQRVVLRLAGGGISDRTGQAKLARDIESLANLLLDPARPGDFNQGMMDLGATVCLPRNPKCLQCPLERLCKTRGEHPTPHRANMSSQDAAYALVLRSRGKIREVLLDQRPAELTVMPSMWELPALRDTQVPDAQLLLAVRHAIMQVNYYVRIRTVHEDDLPALTLASERRYWFSLHDLATLPLTGLARKVLLRAKLPELTPNPPASGSAVNAEQAILGR